MEETVHLLGGKISVGNHPHDERRNHRGHSGSCISSPSKACLDLKGTEEGPHGNIPDAPDEELNEDDIRLLTVDNKLVLPINKNIHVLVTAGDVLHSFAMPSLGVKKDAVPGRLNETWMNIEKTGIYRGQCSELCGTGHGYMPIVIEAVSQEDFIAWVTETKTKLAMNEKNTFAKANTE